MADYKIVSINLVYLSSFLSRTALTHTRIVEQSRTPKAESHPWSASFVSPKTNPANLSGRKKRLRKPGTLVEGDSQKRIKSMDRGGKERCLLIKHFMISFLSSRPFFSGQLNRLCLLLLVRVFGGLIFDSHRFLSSSDHLFFSLFNIGNFSLSHRPEKMFFLLKENFLQEKNSPIDCFSFVSLKTFFLSSRREDGKSRWRWDRVTTLTRDEWNGEDER